MEIYGDLEFFVFIFLASLISLFLNGGLKGFKRTYILIINFLGLYLVLKREEFIRTLLLILYFFLISALHFYIRRRKKSFPFSCIFVLLSLGPLIYLKIYNFLGSPISILGLSYITFRVVQYIIEVYDGIITDFKPLNLIAFYSYFPSFSQGPIDRSRHFEGELAQEDRKTYMEKSARGVEELIIGAAYKFVLSDFFYGLLSGLSESNSLVNLSLYAFLYGLFLFYDFAGYSRMARGFSYILGVELPENFKAPFLAKNIQEFWNRWHISLSSWFRDFIFMRLVRSFGRKKALRKRRTMTSCLSYIINMGLMGLWHGLKANYIIYGLYHGILLAIYEVYKKAGWDKKYGDRKIYKTISWLLTQIAVFFGFLIFSGRLNFLL